MKTVYLSIRHGRNDIESCFTNYDPNSPGTYHFFKSGQFKLTDSLSRFSLCHKRCGDLRNIGTTFWMLKSILDMGITCDIMGHE